jgi:hypothetical protein
LIEAVIEQFPDEVEVKSNGDWTYKKDYEDSPGSVKVRERVVEDGYTHTDEFYSSGVMPRSSEVGLKILKKAFDMSGTDTRALGRVLTYNGE